MSVYWVNYFCYKQTRRLTECSVLAPTADYVSHCHSENTTVLLHYSSGANSVNSVTAIPTTREMYWKKPFSGIGFLTHSVISKYDPDASEVYYKKQRIFLWSNQILQVQITEAGGERARLRCCLSPFISYSFLFLVEDATHRNYRPILMNAIFLLVPRVFFAVW